MYDQWVKAWNGQSNRLPEVVSDSLTVHQSRTDGKRSCKKGLKALMEIIEGSAAFFESGKMTVLPGPIVDGDYIAARWQYSGKYNGKMPGAKAKAGTKVTFTGTDFFRIENNKLVEYWVLSDTMILFQQLQFKATL